MPNPEDSMDWVETFYEKQQQWCNIYAGDVESWHQDKTKSIVLPDREVPYRILELGCGGGQMAMALADLGHDVVAIDMNSDAILNAQRLAAARLDTRIKLVEEDFYSFDPKDLFDVVCYFDGFGIGSDEDQQRLLQRVVSWLKPEGRAFIEIYTPWYWKHVAGTLIEWPDVSRRYKFNKVSCRMLDTWWETDHPDDVVTQSLRCYSPDDLESLLDGINLKLVEVLPGGAYDHKTKTFHPIVPLEDAMQSVLKKHLEQISLGFRGFGWL